MKSFFLLLIVSTLGFCFTGFANENVSEKKPGARFAAYPIIGYTPEQSFVLGAGLHTVFPGKNENNDEHPDNINSLGFYSFKNMYLINIAPSFYFDNGKWLISSVFNLFDTPSEYFGIGNQSDIDNYENYSSFQYIINPSIRYKFFGHFGIGLSISAINTSISAIEDGGRIKRGNISGINGGLEVGVGAFFDWDSRDSLFYPSKGGWYSFKYLQYENLFGSEYEYTSWAVDFRHFFSFYEKHIIAFNFTHINMAGNIPFYSITPLSNIRGVYGILFRDKLMYSIQAEYRFPIYKRFTGAAFGGFGDVMPDYDQIDISESKFGGGVGVRFALNPDDMVNLRLDIGISRLGLLPYIVLMEAF